MGLAGQRNESRRQSFGAKNAGIQWESRRCEKWQLVMKSASACIRVNLTGMRYESDFTKRSGPFARELELARALR